VEKLWKRYTSEERDWLKENYGKLQPEKIVEHLHREWRRIQKQAWALGLARSNATIHRKQVEGRPELTPTEWAYLAGAIEADGHLTLSKNRVKTRFFLSPRMGICNQSLPLMKWLSEKLPVYVHFDAVDANWGWAYRANISGFKVLAVLRGIRPYMIFKDQQCDILMAFCGRRLKASNHVPYCGEDWRAYEQMKALNRPKPKPLDGLKSYR
jgi:hypothetical protein